MFPDSDRGGRERSASMNRWRRSFEVLSRDENLLFLLCEICVGDTDVEDVDVGESWLAEGSPVLWTSRGLVVSTGWDSDGGLPGGLLCCSTLDAEALPDGGWGVGDLSDLSDMMNKTTKWQTKTTIIYRRMRWWSTQCTLATPKGSQRNEDYLQQMKLIKDCKSTLCRRH